MQSQYLWLNNGKNGMPMVCLIMLDKSIYWFLKMHLQNFKASKNNSSTLAHT